MRQLLLLLPFLLPFAGYALYLALAKRAETSGRTLADTPWTWLTVVGLALVALTLLALAVLSESDTGRDYVPAEMRDGRVVPGQVR